MEIERINENTLKFYISYADIEDRGFNREDIWYNREKGEQLFWEMMDEVNDQEEFNIDGPLWIQVQALDKGLEIVVTKAQVSKDGKNLEVSDDEEQPFQTNMDQKIESLIDNNLSNHKQTKNKSRSQSKSKKEKTKQTGDLSLVIQFDDLEDVISLSHTVKDSRFMVDRLYAHDDIYYLYASFPEGYLSEDEQEDYISQLLEFGEESSFTVHYLMEYGNSIFTDEALKEVRSKFA
ncbi:adaptor protein MecA [Halalkalibacillus sediminis]|uniref:Adapter protein MecA n=1 Tax=Halalkalibacillus sediminis TaxID=2018042 RepID=A0A2I0QVK1_9BACI|nr:adaptor protein MecA [Halalkalibacillus sediminis]PKR78348.1 adaptor protein MecA [Halalkalibacillus sediminis]